MDGKSFRIFFPGRREEGQSSPLEDDVVHECIAADPLVPVEAGCQRERQFPGRIDLDMPAVIFGKDAGLLLVVDEMDVPDCLDARNAHQDADSVACVKIRFPGERPEFVRVDESQSRGLEAENLIGLPPGGEKFLHAVELEGRTDIVVHPVIDVLQERTDVHVWIDFDFCADAHLGRLQELDLPEILADIPVLQKQGSDAVPIERLDIVGTHVVRQHGTVDVLSYNGEDVGVIPDCVQPFQFHQDVIIAGQGGGCAGGLVGDMRDFNDLFGLLEPDIPYAGDVLQDEFPIIVDRGGGVRKDDVGREHRPFQGRSLSARTGHQVGHRRRGAVGQVGQGEGQGFEDGDAGIVYVEIRPMAGADAPDIRETVFQQFLVIHRLRQARSIFLVFRHTVGQSAV